MNGNTNIVNLIKDNYTTDDSVSNCDWDEDFNPDADGWVEVWSDRRQKLQWERKLPNGQVVTSTTPPSADYQLVLKARQVKCSQNVVKRICPNSSVMMFDRQRRIQQKKLELVMKERRQIVLERCVVKLQALFRQRKARNAALHLRAQTIAANRIKRRLINLRKQKRYQACITIQSFFRMYATRAYYKEFLRERLLSYRDSRILASCVQRLWRGFKGRSQFRRQLEITTLPDPATDHDFWVQLQIEAGPPKRELGVFAEYILSGNPKTWEERNLIKRHGKYYRDVSLYMNTITRRVSWTKPAGWVFNNVKEYYALRVQTFWRARVAKRKINVLVKANRLLTNTFDSGRTVSDIVSLCNYTFYVHVHLHDYDKARPLYAKMMSYMEMRIDNEWVLHSYAIFAAVSGEQDWEEIKDYGRRAKFQENRRKESGRLVNSAYSIASAAFYLQAVSNEDVPGGIDKSENWHNYAMCQMLVHHDLPCARRSFLRALKLNPHNKTLISNFNVLLQDEDYLGLSTTVHEEYRQALSRKFA